MRRRPPVLILWGLSLATGIVAGLTAVSFSAGSPVYETPAVADVEIAQTYYREVNATLNGASPRGLTTVISEDLVQHPARPGRAAGRDGFVADLLELSSVYHNIQLDADVVNIADDTITFQVSTTSINGGVFLGIPVQSPAVWSAFELLRIKRGQVVERWSTPIVDTFRRPVNARLRVETLGDQALTLAAVDFQPNQAYRFQANNWSVLMNSEGSMSARVDATSRSKVTIRLAREIDGDTLLDTIDPGDLQIMYGGDILEIPPDALLTLRNISALPGRLYLLSVPQPVDQSIHLVDRPRDDIDQPTFRILAEGMGEELPSGDYSVTIGSALLSPGTTFPMHLPASIELVSVVSGSLSRSTTEATGGAAQSTIYETYSIDSGAICLAGTSVSYRVMGSDPAEVLIMTMSPAAAN